MELYSDVNIYCSCGYALQIREMNFKGWAKFYVIDPCPRCTDKAEDIGYQRGKEEIC